MSHATSILLRASALLIVFALSFAHAAPASAGCLTEYDECGECARAAVWDAIRNLDYEGFEDAYLAGLDCDIDVVHCILYGLHHEYSCGA